jgi:hypothetical protein
MFLSRNTAISRISTEGRKNGSFNSCYINKVTRADIRVQATLGAIASIHYGWSVALETPLRPLDGIEGELNMSDSRLLFT